MKKKSIIITCVSALVACSLWLVYFLVRKFKSKKKADSEEDETIDVLDDSLMQMWLNLTINPPLEWYTVYLFIRCTFKLKYLVNDTFVDMELAEIPVAVILAVFVVAIILFPFVDHKFKYVRLMHKCKKEHEYHEQTTTALPYDFMKTLQDNPGVI